MACPIYDGLDPGVPRARATSSSKRIAEEQARRRELRRVEAQLNTHVSGCGTCRNEGHTPGFDVAELHE
jgi:type II secretory pathway component PulJ